MGDPGATQVIIFLLGLMDGESKLNSRVGMCAGRRGAYGGGGMTGKVGQWASNSMSHYPTDWSRGVALMISLPSILKTRCIGKLVFLLASLPQTLPSNFLLI